MHSVVLAVLLAASDPLSFFKPYEGSVQTGKPSEQAFQSFKLPSGPGKDGPKATVEGHSVSAAYKNPEGRSKLEVHANYVEALKRGGFEVVFACKEKECPPSYAVPGWAQLFGGRGYVLGRLARAEGDVWVAIQSASSTTEVLAVVAQPMEGNKAQVDAAALGDALARTGHVAVYGINFDTGKAEVRPDSAPALEQIVKVLSGRATLKLHVVGHTDNVGELGSNLDLSKRRAAAVVKALTAAGVAAARLRPDGVGSLCPVATNDTDEGRAANRRVELVAQ